MSDDLYDSHNGVDSFMGLDGSDDGNDNYYGEINCVEEGLGGLDGSDDGNDNYYGEIVVGNAAIIIDNTK